MKALHLRAAGREKRGATRGRAWTLAPKAFEAAAEPRVIIMAIVFGWLVQGNNKIIYLCGYEVVDLLLHVACLSKSV
jgi:hypothetical protein